MPESDRPEDTEEKQSCVPHFDALWFCYCECCCFAWNDELLCKANPGVLLTAPVYQFQHYYKFGKADDCSGQWSNLYSCLKSRTKFKVQVPMSHKLHARHVADVLLRHKIVVNVQAPEAPKHPLWTIRSKEEAEQYWKSQYGSANFKGGEQEGRKD